MQGAYALPPIVTRFGTLFGQVEGLPYIHDEEALYRGLAKQGKLRCTHRYLHDTTLPRIDGLTQDEQEALRAEGYIPSPEYGRQHGRNGQAVWALARHGNLDYKQGGTYVSCSKVTGKPQKQPLLWVREKR